MPNYKITLFTIKPHTNETDLDNCYNALSHAPLTCVDRHHTILPHYVTLILNIQTQLSLQKLITLCGQATSPYNVDFYVHTHVDKDYKIFIADMDKTLIMEECIDIMADSIGVGDVIKEITEQAMQGKIDFVQALYKRVNLLKRMSQETLYEVRQEITLRQHMPLLLSTLKKKGIYTILISGGFSFFVEYFANLLNFDRYFSNVLCIKNDMLTGELEGKIVDAAFKRDTLLHFCKTLNVSPDEVIAMGDGANDMPMLQEAGLAISMEGKDILKPVCNLQLQHCKADILPFLL